MLFEKQRIKLQKASIRYIIFIYFTLTALAASIFIGISLYSRLSGQMSATIREENQILINQITRSMEDYLRIVMKLSDSPVLWGYQERGSGQRLHRKRDDPSL